MKTFSQLTDEVLANLRSHVRDQELSTYLTMPLAVDDLTLTVADTSVLSRGRVEIGDELLWVESANRQGVTAVIPPYGRGMDGTTAASYASGVRVVVSPLIARKTVQDALNGAVRAIGAHLYGVSSASFTPSTTTFAYEMPAAAKKILSVRLSDTSGGTDVFWLRDWQLDEQAPSNVSTTGKALYVYDGIWRASSRITATYSLDPVEFTSSSQSITDTYLPATAEDLLVLHATHRLLPTIEIAAMQTRSLEASALANRIQPGGSLQQSKFYYALFQQRLEEERVRLLNSTANRSHYSR